MQIQTSLTSEPSRISKLLDGSLILCAVGTLVALLLVLDAYEYIVLPGASRANDRSPTSASVLDVQDENTDMQLELENAQRYIEQKRAELKNLSVEQIETVAERDGVDDSQLKADEERLELKGDVALQSPKSETVKGTTMLEEKIEAEKEEIIEEILDKEIGLEEWCPECIWLGTSQISCEDRLKWIKRYYKAEDESGKIALMKEGCSVKSGKVGAGKKKDEQSRLLR